MHTFTPSPPSSLVRRDTVTKLLELLHFLEGQQVGLDGDAEVTHAPQDLESPGLLDTMLKALSVDLQNLVSTFQPNVISLGAPLHF